MKKVVLIRHGESVWNKENRFTGWTDVDLSEKGIQEAHEAGKLLKKEGFHLRKSLYFLSEKSHQDIEYRARRNGFGLDSGRENLASKRKTLRDVAKA